jgi:hypothetical protein
MNKKLYFILLAMAAILPLQPLMADPEILDLQITIDDPVNNDGQHRSPILVPVLYIDGYTLTASDNTIGSTIQLMDENDNVVFSTYVYMEGDINLPTTLSGTYTIRVIRGNQVFEGEIVL